MGNDCIEKKLDWRLSICFVSRAGIIHISSNFSLILIAPRIRGAEIVPRAWYTSCQLSQHVFRGGSRGSLGVPGGPWGVLGTSCAGSGRYLRPARASLGVCGSPWGLAGPPHRVVYRMGGGHSEPELSSEP